MTKFREHRGGLAESLETTVEVQTKAELAAHMRSKISPFGFFFEDDDLTVEPYVLVLLDAQDVPDLDLRRRPEAVVVGRDAGHPGLPVAGHGEVDLGAAFDDRIGWDTYIVQIDGYGVAGFTNGALT